MTETEELTLLKAAVRRMHEADDEYGCGFYGTAEWHAAYDDTRKLAGMKDKQ